MTDNVKALELVSNLANHVIFDASKDDTPIVRPCKLNDILIKNMTALGEFDPTDKDDVMNFGAILMVARIKQLSDFLSET